MATMFRQYTSPTHLFTLISSIYHKGSSCYVYTYYVYFLFFAARCIAWTMLLQDVCQSVCHVPLLCQNDWTHRWNSFILSLWDLS